MFDGVDLAHFTEVMAHRHRNAAKGVDLLEIANKLPQVALLQGSLILPDGGSCAYPLLFLAAVFAPMLGCANSAPQEIC